MKIHSQYNPFILDVADALAMGIHPITFDIYAHGAILTDQIRLPPFCIFKSLGYHFSLRQMRLMIQSNFKQLFNVITFGSI